MQRQPIRRHRAYASREDSLENWSPVRYLQRRDKDDGMLMDVPKERPRQENSLRVVG